MSENQSSQNAARLFLLARFQTGFGMGVPFLKPFGVIFVTQRPRPLCFCRRSIEKDLLAIHNPH
jgi:hypothetical protein